MKAPPKKLYDLNKPLEQKTVIADTGDVGNRLDVFLKPLTPWRSRTRIRELFDEGRVTVNGVHRKPGYKMRNGDKVVLRFPPQDIREPVREIPLDILYEDSDLIVLNKQPGVICHPVGKVLYNTLINALHKRYRNFEDPKKDVVPRLCHRLDKQTSGVLIVTKNEDVLYDLYFQFERRQVEKEYIALVEGRIEGEEGRIDLPIGQAVGSEIRIKRGIQQEGGLPSVTDYRVVQRFAHFTEVRAIPKTGRLHQIRVHLEAIGHPVVCDKLYGRCDKLFLSDLRPLAPGEEDRCLLSRQALHCARMTIFHPGLKRPMSFEAPLTPDLRQVLKILAATGSPTSPV
ncbi:MAG: RluA family pseudouridine synthase [Planctomycetes bacterium]|nr:RluA family pseudouridine synthase [Planctomycetota bacterium]